MSICMYGGQKTDNFLPCYEKYYSQHVSLGLRTGSLTLADAALVAMARGHGVVSGDLFLQTP